MGTPVLTLLLSSDYYISGIECGPMQIHRTGRSVKQMMISVGPTCLFTLSMYLYPCFAY